MEKTIYCKIGERRKKIKYTYNTVKSDIESATDKIREVCRNDPLLQKIVENRAIILQRWLEDKNFLCDFEPEEEIPNESEVHCLLVPFLDENTFIFAEDYTVNQDGILVTPGENTSQSIQEEKKVRLFSYFEPFSLILSEIFFFVKWDPKFFSIEAFFLTSNAIEWEKKGKFLVVEAFF